MAIPKANAGYFFNGFLFAEFIDTDKFKEDINKLELTEVKEQWDLAQLFENIVLTNPMIKSKVDKVFFENILYSHLKNVYVNKITAHPSLAIELFKQKVKGLIEELNYKETIPMNYYSEMKDDGFYLMDALHITVTGTKFLAGYDFTEKNGVVKEARFLFVEVVRRGEKPCYFISGVSINFETGVSMILIRNIQGISKENDDLEAPNNTVNKLYYQVLKSVYEKLDIKLDKIDITADREGMYNFCKELDDYLLEDIRMEVTKKTTEQIKQSVQNLNKTLFPSEKRLSSTDKQDLGDKINSILLAYYLKYNITSKELVEKAKRLNLKGYPTKIKFMGSNSTRSSTQSASSKQPVVISDDYHGLYFSFTEALELEKWSISWFTDFKFDILADVDVIQTTIHSTRNNFKIVFLPDRPLEKEIIEHVVTSINSYR
ncbi:hypothetical protein H7U08_19375 [Bacillus cereus]|uniref:Uncharacterized protein n=1 Tax=Bacillus cereus TaxID=1396 RepID=A0AAW4QYB5_BACCE|nr:hypothetical protein [Bacillus cereus]MBY0038676.1 hypothetical protein [Bacillus cereus]